MLLGSRRRRVKRIDVVLSGQSVRPPGGSQRLQYHLVKEYSLNYSRVDPIPSMIYGYIP